MRDSGPDKPFILDGPRNQIKKSSPISAAALLILLSTLQLGGCASAPPGSSDPQPQPERGAVLDETARQQLAEARQARELGDVSAALDLYLQAMNGTDVPEAAEQATRLAAQLGDWDAVERAATRWMSLDSLDDAPHQFAVLAAFRQDDADAAARRLAAFVQRRPGDPSIWSAVTALLPLASSAEVAGGMLDALLQRFSPVDEPGFADFQRSRLQVQLDDLDAALRFADRSVAAEPSAAGAMWAGRLAEALGDVERARERFAAARTLADEPVGPGLAEVELLRANDRQVEALDVLEALPSTVEVLYARVLVEQQLGLDEEARRSWRALEEVRQDLEPGIDPSQTLWLSALAAETVGLADEAIERYEQVGGALGLDADLRRAALLGEQDRMDEASELFEQVRATPDPQRSEQAWLIEAEQRIARDEGDLAIDLFNDALTQMPGSSALLYGRAMAAVRLDRIDLAEQDLRTLIQREPDNALALNALGYTLSDRTDRQREAYRLIDRALALQPDNPAILDSMGWVLFKLDRPEQALPYLERAVDGDFNPEIVAHLVDVLWALDRGEQAEVWADRGSDAFPDDALLRSTLDRLGIAP